MARTIPLLAVAVLLTVTVSGCFEAYRVHVPQDILERSAVEWVIENGSQKGSFFGTKTVETTYRFHPSETPPYPGILQVFSIRERDHRSPEDLLDFTRSAVEDAAKREGIAINSDQDDEGTRTLANGKETTWFTREGEVTRTGTLFDDHVTVRILGEAGYDGNSRTSFVAVALVQVAQESDVLIGFGQRTDHTTWEAVVGDPSGSIGGAVDEQGLVYWLQTHG